MLSGFTILVKDVTAPRDQRKFVKGSQPTKKERRIFQRESAKWNTQERKDTKKKMLTFPSFHLLASVTGVVQRL